MRSHRLWIYAAVLFMITTLGASINPAWGQALPTDPRLVTGELENGFKYVILKHDNPPGRAVVYMHVSSGSLNETDKQRGIAHYLEHMAFNGSEHFKPGEVVPFFQSIGLSFGRHQNAFTSFDQTTYQLELPNNQPETLEKGLLFFSDVAFRLSLLPEEIENERQIILEEKRARLSARQRIGEYILANLAPGSTIGRRLPIGTEETILGVTEPDFRDYYSKWYTPSNTTLIVVADMDPAVVVELVKKQFADGPKREKPADIDAEVQPQTASRAIVATDDEITEATVTIARIAPAKPPVTTMRAYRDELVERLGFEAFNRRVGKKVDQGKVKFLSAGAGSGTQARVLRQTQARASGKPGEWKAMLQDLALEIRRAAEHGFNAWEVEDARKEMLASLERSAERESTLPASALIRQLNGRIAAQEPMMSAQERLEVARTLLATIDPKEVNWAFAAAFDPQALTFIAELPKSILDGPPAPTEAELLDVGTQAMAIKPAAEEFARVDKPILEEQPTPGTVVEQATHEASGVTTAWLSNGVRVNHRFMDYFKNDARVSIVLAGGELLETDSNRGISRAAALAWTTPATKRLSATEITDLMVGTKMQVSGTAGQDVMTLAISGNPADFDRGFQLAHALLTEPRIESAALDRLKTGMLQAIRGNMLDPGGRFGMLLADTVYPKGDPRPRFPTEEHVNRLNLADAQAWLDQRIKESPIEVTIVGDIPLARALELATTYLGSLPPRDRISKDTYASLRAVPAPSGPREQTLDFPTQTQRSMVLAGFGGPDASNVRDARLMNMAAKILTNRMVKEVREAEQLVYSISASSTAAEVFPGYGIFFASAPTDPQKVERLVAKLESMYDEFAKNGPAEDEVDIVKKQQANLLDESMKTPNFWAGQVSGLAYRHRNLDDILAGPEAYENMTADEIKEAFNRYYSPEKRIRVALKSLPAAAEPAKQP